MGHYRKELITFFITDHCNMNCIYCYCKDYAYKEKKLDQIDLSFAKAGIDDFFEQSNSRSIRFFGGGEPTLGFKRMKEIREYAFKKAGEELYVEIQTNGFFSKNVTNWVKENVDMIWVSCDGPPNIQDKYRPTFGNKPTSMTVEKNIKEISKSGKTKIGIRVTIGEFNINKQKEMIDYFADLGIIGISVYPIFGPVTRVSYRFIDTLKLLEVASTDKFVNKFVEGFYYAKDKGIFYGSILTSNFDEGVDISCRTMIPVPHLTPDGYVSCCDMAFNGKTHLQDLLYGIYDKKKKKIHYFEDKIKLIRARNVQNLKYCENCIVRRHCAGSCLGEALNETGSIFGIKKSNCMKIIELYKRLPPSNGLYPYLNP